ncbi:MAG: WbuC family cupin fold metalloprotein [Bryobacterales bacterium]|nr:WbuC family cupin fold metalloprotein [Bryobacterales bacterium]
MTIRKPYQLISQDQIEAVAARAEALPRRRLNWNLHATMEEPAHRFLNVMLKGSYVAPHRHTAPPKPETFVVLEGEVALLQFSEGGEVEVVSLLGPETQPRIWGIDLMAGVWHSLVVLSPMAAIFEVKPGPYSPATDKDFAAWAPREGEPGVPEYLARLEAAARQAREDGR